VFCETVYFWAGPPRIPEICGAKEIRTPDLFDANEALYQLSYSPGKVRLPGRICGTGELRLQIFLSHCQLMSGAPALEDVVEVAECALGLGERLG
jgi:hypothetical protein